MSFLEEHFNEGLEVEVRDEDLVSGRVENSVKTLILIEDCLSVVVLENAIDSRLTITDADGFHAHGPEVVVVNCLVFHVSDVDVITVEFAVINPAVDIILVSGEAS